MNFRSTLPALLAISVLSMLACQFLAPAQQSCRVNMPGTGWVVHQHLDEISFTVDQIEWRAHVDCSAGRLVDGQPVLAARARDVSLSVDGTSYRLISSDSKASITEYRSNGSHVRIDSGDRYYVAVLAASPGNLGHAMIRYFVGGQSPDGMIHLYCYNQTMGEEHHSLPTLASMWTVSRPLAVSLICAARGLTLELSTQVTLPMLLAGPTPVPVIPAPTDTPVPLGDFASH